VIRKHDVDAAVAFAERACESLDRAAIGNVEDFAAYLGSAGRGAAGRLGDAANVTSRQIDDIIRAEAPSQPLGEAKAEIARRARHNRYCAHGRDNSQSIN
jgi:hypothetical protein